MRKLRTTAQFRRDLKRLGRRGKDSEKLHSVIARLVAGEPLDLINRPHRLSGEWAPCWECHIEPDWLLVWDEDKESITLIRTGTHSDLFR